MIIIVPKPPSQSSFRPRREKAVKRKGLLKKSQETIISKKAEQKSRIERIG
jgi:hypothetical protein